MTALLTFLLAKNHQKEKRYGPSPTNNYTTGSGRRGIGSRLGFGRRRGAKTTRDAEAAAGVGLTGTALEEKHHHENRTDGMVTGTTNGTSDLKDGYGNGNSNFDRAPATHYRNV